MDLKQIKKSTRRFFRKLTKKETLVKVIVIASGLALLATTVLPYLLI
jgi:hypothetical protein